jgi:hypothetical protein
MHITSAVRTRYDHSNNAHASAKSEHSIPRQRQRQIKTTRAAHQNNGSSISRQRHQHIKTTTATHEKTTKRNENGKAQAVIIALHLSRQEYYQWTTHQPTTMKIKAKQKDRRHQTMTRDRTERSHAQVATGHRSPSRKQKGEGQELQTPAARS